MNTIFQVFMFNDFSVPFAWAVQERVYRSSSILCDGNRNLYLTINEPIRPIIDYAHSLWDKLTYYPVPHLKPIISRVIVHVKQNDRMSQKIFQSRICWVFDHMGSMHILHMCSPRPSYSNPECICLLVLLSYNSRVANERYWVVEIDYTTQRLNLGMKFNIIITVYNFVIC